MFKYLAPAAIATFMALTPAHALPVASSGAAPAADASPAALTLIADRDGDGRRDRMHRDGDRRGHWVPGRRYDNAPSGWHRYGRRPGNWRSRGCILVGPIWFCP